MSSVTDSVFETYDFNITLEQLIFGNNKAYLDYNGKKVKTSFKEKMTFLHSLA